jgi:hypothetical protein
MTPAIAGMLAGGVAAGYVPSLRSQIREGEVRVPAGGVIPLRVRRDDHPLAFRLCAAGMVLLTAGLMAVGVALVAEALR